MYSNKYIAFIEVFTDFLPTVASQRQSISHDQTLTGPPEEDQGSERQNKRPRLIKAASHSESWTFLHVAEAYENHSRPFASATIWCFQFGKLQLLKLSKELEEELRWRPEESFLDRLSWKTSGHLNMEQALQMSGIWLDRIVSRGFLWAFSWSLR